MQTIWQTLLQTPWWVYVLLVYLIKVGMNASKTKVVSIFKLFIIPIVFVFLSIHTLMSTFKIGTHSLLTWFVAISLGIILGYLQINRAELKVDRTHLLMQIPGSKTTLFYILIIFATKYYFGYKLSADPQIIHESLFKFLMLGLSGLFTGLFVGRLICYLYYFKKNPSLDLSSQR